MRFLRVGTNRPQGDCYGVDNMSSSAVAEGLRNDRIARSSNGFYASLNPATALKTYTCARGPPTL